MCATFGTVLLIKTSEVFKNFGSLILQSENDSGGFQYLIQLHFYNFPYLIDKLLLR